MDEAKKRNLETEAQTLVASGISSSGRDVPSGQGSPVPAAVSGDSSDLPTLVDDAGRGTLRAGSKVRPMADPAANLQPGTVFAKRYEIDSMLGKGGMGAVYKARDLELERVVALKVIRRELSDDPEILLRFKQELILARQITDRNIIRIFDLGESGGTRFITMEYVDGENLHQLLKQRGKLDPGEAVEIMEQVAAGLSAAHREGIIHRDLKPSNIMRDVNGRVVIMDFGLARTVGSEGMTRTGAMLGTLEYMSPEQAQGKELKASSDIFTTGLILYELLFGATPFQAESAIASLLMRAQQRAIPLADIDKNIPGTLSNITAKCLEKDPANRYQSAEELDADLRAWQGKGAGKKVSASSLRLRMIRLRELPWRRLAVAGLLVVAIAAGTTWFVSRRQPVAKDRSACPNLGAGGGFCEPHRGPCFGQYPGADARLGA